METALTREFALLHRCPIFTEMLPPDRTVEASLPWSPPIQQLEGHSRTAHRVRVQPIFCRDSCSSKGSAYTARQRLDLRPAAAALPHRQHRIGAQLIMIVQILVRVRRCAAPTTPPPCVRSTAHPDDPCTQVGDQTRPPSTSRTVQFKPDLFTLCSHKGRLRRMGSKHFIPSRAAF